MNKYSFTNKAVKDLTGIWNYTYETWSEKQAEKYYNQILDLCLTISQKPSLSKHYPQVSEDIFGFLANIHIIFYSIIGPNEILIIRILHSSMDLKTRINQ